MLIHSRDTLSPFISSEIEKILKRLLEHEPIQYIIGETRFHGMHLKVTPDVLIPRPETDELVDLVIDEFQHRSDLKVLDIGTGSGCIAIALARNLKFSKVTAIDFSAKALKVARENAEALKTKITFIHADINNWNSLTSYDIIISNPPYIESREALEMEPNVLLYEPHCALFVDDNNPLELYLRIADISLYSLNPAGALYLEINPKHALNLKTLFTEKGFKAEVITDSFGKQRFLKCVKF